MGDTKKDEFMSILESQNTPITKELIEVLIRNAQQSTEQSTMVRSSLINMKEQLDEIEKEANKTSEKFNTLLASLENCPIRKDELALSKIKVDIENIKINLAEFKRDNSDFIDSIEDHIINPYNQAGGIVNFFTKILRKNGTNLIIILLIIDILQTIIFYFGVGN